jgi:peptidoglycan hydrolase CwlO-like protein
VLTELEEYTHLKNLFGNIQKIWGKQYTFAEITQQLKSYRSEFRKPDYPFYFRKGVEDASYFNLKYYLLSKSIDDFNKYFEKLNGNQEKITEYIAKIEILDNAIRGKLLLEEIDKKLKLSVKIFQFISTIQNVPIEAECASRLVISDLENFFASAHFNREQFKKQLDSILKNLNQITKNEKELQDKITETEKSLKNYSQFIVGITEQLHQIKELQERMGKIQTRYEELIFNFEDTDQGNLSLLISNLDTILTNIKTLNSEIQIINSELKRLDDEFIEIIDDFKKANEKIFEIFKKEKNIKILKTEFELLCSSSIEIIKNVLSLPQEKSWQTIYDELDAFRRKFFTELRQIIHGEESNVLFELVSILSKRGWKDYSEIVKTISNKLKISEDETEELITKLTERGIIRKALSYPN